MTTLVIRRYRAIGWTAWLQWLLAAAQWVHRTFCALKGHHFVMHRERLRICLECTDCGYQTHGWVLTPGVFTTRRVDQRPSTRSVPAR